MVITWQAGIQLFRGKKLGKKPVGSYGSCCQQSHDWAFMLSAVPSWLSKYNINCLNSRGEQKAVPQKVDSTYY